MALQLASVVPMLTTLVIVSFLYLCATATTQAYPYRCVPRGHVEGEVIKPGLEWNLELLV